MEFKVGDVVICKPGFTNSDFDSLGEPRGGAGYKPGFVFTVGHRTLTYGSRELILWPNIGGSGVYANAVRLYFIEGILTEEELERIDKLNYHEL